MNILLLVVVGGLCGCVSTIKEERTLCLSCDYEEEMNRAVKELEAFDNTVISLYDVGESDPRKVIKQTHLLIEQVKADPDSNGVRDNKLVMLHQLRAELFYKIKQYDSSIIEARDFNYTDEYVLACNYVKLKDYATAKNYIDSNQGYYIYEFILGNYYEVIGDKDRALKVYAGTKNNKDSEHYFYYDLVLKRIEELGKPDPKLLSELYYLTSRPDFESWPNR